MHKAGCIVADNSDCTEVEDMIAEVEHTKERDYIVCHTLASFRQKNLRLFKNRLFVVFRSFFKRPRHFPQIRNKTKQNRKSGAAQTY